MPPLSMTVVNVHDMSCAQALALVAKAADALRPSESLEVQFSTEDVRSDLIIWALSKGFVVQDAAKELLRLTKGR